MDKYNINYELFRKYYKQMQILFYTSRYKRFYPFITKYTLQHINIQDEELIIVENHYYRQTITYC